MNWGLLNVFMSALGTLISLGILRGSKAGKVPLELRAVLDWVCSLLLVGLAPAPPVFITWVYF